MASIVKATLRRYNGTDWDAFHPRTDTDQVEGLSDLLSDKANKSDIGSSGGIAPLNSDTKIDLEYLPETAITGMDMKGVMSSSGDAEDFFEDTAGVEEETGSYEIVGSSTSDGEMTLDPENDMDLSEKVAFKDPQGDGYTATLTVQSGDWLVYTGYEWTDSDGDIGDTDETYWIYGLIDNNQSERYLNKTTGGTLKGSLDMDGNTINKVKELYLEGADTGEYLNANSDQGLRWGNATVWTADNSDEFNENGTYDDLVAKGTKPDDIGAAPEDHSHSDYLKISGGNSMEDSLDMDGHSISKVKEIFLEDADTGDTLNASSSQGLRWGNATVWHASNNEFRDIHFGSEPSDPRTDSLWFDAS